MPVLTSADIILLFLVRRPSPTLAYSIHLRGVDGVIFISYFLTVFTKKCMHMHTYLEFIYIMTKLLVQILVIIKQWFELYRIATNDSKYYRQPMFSSSYY